MAIKVLNLDGSESASLELPGEIFGQEPNETVVHSYVVGYLANQRQGTASTLRRSEVSGGGRKPWRQKGTGRARAGTIRSPLWPGGGKVFGPKPRGYTQRLPKKQKRLAVISAFSDMARRDRIKVLDRLEMPDHKTKNFAALLNRLGLTGQKVLFLDEGQNVNVGRASRNLPGIRVARARLANAYDILNADCLVITRAGLKEIEEVFS